MCFSIWNYQGNSVLAITPKTERRAQLPTPMGTIIPAMSICVNSFIAFFRHFPVVFCGLDVAFPHQVSSRKNPAVVAHRGVVPVTPKPDSGPGPGGL
jgi:hypothetical protein